MIVEFLKDINEKIKVGNQKKVPPAIANKLVADGYAKIISLENNSEVITKNA